MPVTDIQLYWPEGTPSPELEQAVVEDLRKWISADLDTPGDLMFHIVMLGGEPEGPSVLVKGIEGDGRFHCFYSDEFAGMTIDKADVHPNVRKKLWPEDEGENE
jgi:hypothetical protein